MTKSIRKKKTICPLDCPDSCALIATVKDNQVVSLSGDPDHPYTRGMICRKMRRYPERLKAPARVLYPRIRAGRKGAGEFRRISWDEAWQCLTAQISRTLTEFGGEAILPYCYAGNMGLVNRYAGFPLFHKLGASRLHQTICSATAAGGWRAICGNAGGTPPERAVEADLIVAWGINIRVSNTHFWPQVRSAVKRGAKLLVIDPYRNATARVADEHVWVKPGGDGALALGILKMLLAEQRLDQRFIAERSVGFEELAGYLERTAIEAFAHHSGVAAEDIARLARLFGDHPRTFIRIGAGLTRNSRGGMAVRAIGSLAAACGLFSGGTGRGVLLFAGAFGGDAAQLTMPELAQQQGREVNMIHLGEALNSFDPPIRMLLVYNANPFSVAPDGSMVRKGLGREDLFTVVHEQVMTPTARYADLLLPATTFLENRDIYKPYGHFFLGFADRVIEPMGEAISNFDLFQSLGRKLGFTDEAFRQSLDQRLQRYVRTIPELDADFELDRHLDGGYVESPRAHDRHSPFDRKRPFRFISVDDPTLPRVPHLCDGAEFDHPDLSARFPFKLITPPDDKLLNSTFGEMYPDESGRVLIHPEDGAKRGIGDGEFVYLHNFRGRLKRRAQVSDDTQPGLLVAEGLYWPLKDEDGGVNDLTSQQCSDIGGGAIFHEARVQIEPAD